MDVRAEVASAGVASVDGMPERPQPAEWRRRGASFGPAAELYDAARPRYPIEAVRWALAPLGPGRWRVADVGAGTGIMSRILLQLGHEVIAVEPDDRMRARLHASTPGALATAGSAEQLPVADAELDAAVAAQAYHWFDHDLAHLELARAVRPDGVFAAIWNVRDDAAARWVAEYSRIVEGERGPVADGYDDRDPSFGDGFGAPELRAFPHTVRQTPDSLLALLRSRSYYLTGSPQRRAELDRAVSQLARNHPDLAGRQEFALPYLTRVYRARRG